MDASAGPPDEPRAGEPPASSLGDPPRPAVPRQAAGVMLLRGGDRFLEVLLVERNPAARFMPGAWVFPGGAVDRADGEAGHAAAAVRELAEEAGIWLADAPELVPFSRWVTPPELPIRFDTLFFLAAAPAGAEPQADGEETVAAAWWSPRAALGAERRGELLLSFPTIRQLGQLAGFDSAGALLAWARGREVVPVMPRIVGSGPSARVVLPGEPEHTG